ncbi:hypothetical protein FHL15_009683 [Xylaria flabelliformis]|uniref:Uncharacterized protein n=1 Tax=Xylaria flabelliformis TaxID=2512241 RepID=A0A553HN55_9PEZI|nr:hypothetical protein FHL15_009683 [Xylaria flabelliformis]
MTNTPATASRRTIQDYGLARYDLYVNPADLAFIEPYANPTGSLNPAWVGFSIEDKRNTIGSFCAVSTSLNAYVTTAVFLTLSENIGANRLTPMRLREMIVDTYLAAGGNLNTLRFLGTKSIINIVTRNQIERLFQRAGKDFTRPGSIELLPEHKEFASDVLGNPFTRCIRSLLRHHEIETGFAKMKRFTFLSKGLLPDDRVDDDRPELSLVIELCRPGEDGYPAGDDS